MSSPDLTDQETNAVTSVLANTSLSLGPQVEKFENAFSTYLGIPHAVAVSSGTSGLHLAVIAGGIEENSMVITTPFSFIASANCILYERAIPVFVDVEEKTGNIDPHLVEEAAHDLVKGGSAVRRWLPPTLAPSGEQKLRAILLVHTFGQPADMDPILSVARDHRLLVIEDACEAIGTEYRGRKVGALGDVGVFAFYPNKQMTTGEGGMILTARPDWAKLFRSLRNQGRDMSDTWLKHPRLGYNYRLGEMSAALGLVQLGRIEELLAKRAKVAQWYEERLAGHELIETPKVSSCTSRMSWFVYVVRLKPPLSRDAIIDDLAAGGIPSRPYFTPIHLQPFYQERFGYSPGDFPVSEYLGSVSLALPFSGKMTEDEVALVCDCLLRTVA